MVALRWSGSWGIADRLLRWRLPNTETPGLLRHTFGVLRSTLLPGSDSLPGWLRAEVYGGQTLWLATLIACWSGPGGDIVYRAIKYSAARLRSPLDHWTMVAPPIVIAPHRGGQPFPRLGPQPGRVPGPGRKSTVVLFLFPLESLQGRRRDIIASTRVVEGMRRASLLRILASILGTLAGVWIVLDGLQALGADIVPLLAGLGVGGLAVALAVRPTLENLIGGLILYRQAGAGRRLLLRRPDGDRREHRPARLPSVASTGH